MTNYFKDWIKVVDLNILSNILNSLKKVNRTLLCPHPDNIFKAFELCKYNNLKVVILGQDPYPQKDIATGIAFGNSTDEISPSLNILKESCIDFTIPHNSIIFDNSLESWCKQGVLLLNSALTCELNKPGSHTMLWRPFIKKLLINLSYRESGLIYILLGDNAKTFEPYINSKYNWVLKEKHPSYYARMNKLMPSTIFKETNKILKDNYNLKINWYEEND